MTPRLPHCPELRRAINALPFPEWRQVMRRRLIHRLGINAVARQLGMGHWRAKRIERLATEALARLPG